MVLDSILLHIVSPTFFDSLSTVYSFSASASSFFHFPFRKSQAFLIVQFCLILLLHFVVCFTLVLSVPWPIPFSVLKLVQPTSIHIPIPIPRKRLRPLLDLEPLPEPAASYLISRLLRGLNFERPDRGCQPNRPAHSPNKKRIRLDFGAIEYLIRLVSPLRRDCIFLLRRTGAEPRSMNPVLANGASVRRQLLTLRSDIYI